MNNDYFSPSMDNYASSYHYSYETSSPTPYYYSPMFPTSCPLHSPYNFYTTTSSPTSNNLSPFSFTYVQPTEMYSSPTPLPPVQQQSIPLPGADRTPLRRHKCFKKHELQILHQVYIRDPHPTTDILQQLAAQLQTPLDKVRQWFKNRRHSDKQKKRDNTTARTSTTA